MGCNKSTMCFTCMSAGVIKCRVVWNGFIGNCKSFLSAPPSSQHSVIVSSPIAVFDDLAYTVLPVALSAGDSEA